MICSSAWNHWLIFSFMYFSIIYLDRNVLLRTSQSYPNWLLGFVYFFQNGKASPKRVILMIYWNFICLMTSSYFLPFLDRPLPLLKYFYKIMNFSFYLGKSINIIIFIKKRQNKLLCMPVWLWHVYNRPNYKRIRRNCDNIWNTGRAWKICCWKRI